MEPGARTIELSLATLEHRTEIYAIRHEVLSRELRQYPDNPAGVLQDPLDKINSYVRLVENEHPSLARSVHRHLLPRVRVSIEANP